MVTNCGRTQQPSSAIHLILIETASDPSVGHGCESVFLGMPLPDEPAKDRTKMMVYTRMTGSWSSVKNPPTDERVDESSLGATYLSRACKNPEMPLIVALDPVSHAFWVFFRC